ncbi:mRNA 3'-end-processing protein yth1 [Alternaria alternata]|nr:mRNA 3'-end-processing protein yth1 [Alternaria alternata]
MYTSDKHFKDPYRFVPERWLGEESYEADKKTVHQPFSYGPRDCIGKRLDHPFRILNLDKLCLSDAVWGHSSFRSGIARGRPQILSLEKELTGTVPTLFMTETVHNAVLVVSVVIHLFQGSRTVTLSVIDCSWRKLSDRISWRRGFARDRTVGLPGTCSTVSKERSQGALAGCRAYQPGSGQPLGIHCLQPEPTD